ncbi:tripartite motif-containing protein 2-like [Mytilus trossulus]|uniref:tripartite motif-containing protein 2-like n=1 Tax=Mytilus trossulus TaxID=6551 RepID=UPI00300534AA
MAANESPQFCDVCLNRDLNKTAEEYCQQCEEVLCRECGDHHKISRSSKSHKTITVEKYNRLPSFIKKIKHNCEEHDFVLEFFCKSHDSLCCKICSITAHKACKEIMFIEDILTPSKGHPSVALDNIEKVLKNLESNISSAIKDRNRNLTDLREQKRVITEQIKEKRQEINKLLDNFEKALLEKASALETEYCQKTEEVIAKLIEGKQKVDEIKNDVESVKSFASNLQIFIGSKSFEESVSTNELNVQKLYDDGSLNNVTMECTFNEKLEQFIKEINAFGDMRVDNSEKHVSFPWKSYTSAQIFKPISGAKSVENISVKILRKINIGRNGITGCAMSESGNMLFLVAHKNSLMKYSSNGEFQSELHINTAPSNIGYDLAVVDSNTIAVSTGGNSPNQIYLIDMNNAEIRQNVDLETFCYGLCYHNGSLICCTYDKGIQIFENQKNFTRMLVLPTATKSFGYTYITSNGNSIFHSNCRNNSVVCYDYNGQVKWTYCDSLLRKPYGITVDSYSNIYVAGFESNNIVVISSDGKQAKELIGASDGLSKPHAVFVHKTKNVILCANHDGVAFLFDVSCSKHSAD